MKAYGVPRTDTPNRKLPGQQRFCPCCTPRKFHDKSKSFKHKERQKRTDDVEMK